MANTTSDKLSRLLNTKAKIKNAIVSAGITIPAGTVFNDYSDYISLIPTGVEETTPLEDLMVIVDQYYEIEDGLYVEHTYTQEEQQELLDLVDLILEGE